MDEVSSNGTHHRRSGSVRSSHSRAKRRSKGGIVPDGKSPVPAIITAVLIIMLLVAVYFGKISGCFAPEVDPDVAAETFRPELTPMPSLSPADPMSALNDKTLTVYAVDVGEGECSLLLSPNGKTMLIDSGDEAHYPAVDSLLKGLGVTKLDVIIVTASGSGHIGAMPSVINDYTVGRVCCCPCAQEDDPSWIALMNALEGKPDIPVEELWAGSSLHWDNSCNVSVFLPVKGSGDSSVVMRVQHSGKSVLFASELGGDGVSELLARYTADQLRSTVLRVASGGAEGAADEALLAAVSPEYAVISVGAGQAGCPADITLANLNSRGVVIKRTDKNGSVRIVIERSVITVY